MANGKNNQHPFAPGNAISREQLLKYASGDATPREQFEVELQMEHDPLLAEAIEGLSSPGAVDGFRELDAKRPGNGFFNGHFLITVLIVISIASILVLLVDQLSTNAEPVMNLNDASIERVSTVDLNLSGIDQEERSELNSDAINNEGSKRTEQTILRSFEAITSDPIRTEREEDLRSLEPITIAPETIRTALDPTFKKKHQNTTGLQLHYLHDLKLIHPKELDHQAPFAGTINENTTADRSDRNGIGIIETDQRSIEYLTFMHEALGYYTTGSFQKCVVELQIVLDQYPNDPNALFYSALSNFQLKNFRIARKHFDRVLAHRFNIFDEEAFWYHAQTLEALGEITAAQKQYSFIVSEDGFYSDRAREKLK